MREAQVTRARRRFRIGRALDRYVFGEFVTIFVVTALGLPVLVFISTAVQELKKYLERQLPWGDVLLAYAYWLPETVFNVLPAAVLFAAVFTIGAITRHSEITAAKASGISFYRLIAPIFVGATLAMGVGLGLGEVAPQWNAGRLALLRDPGARGAQGNVRVRFAFAGEGGRVYKAAQLLVDSGKMTVVEIERRGTGPDYPTQLIAAEHARWTPRAGWMMRHGTFHLLPGDTGPAAERDVAFSFDSLVDRRLTERPRDLMRSAKAPEDMGYAELGRYIEAQARSGSDVNALRVSRMLKLAVPVTCVIIVLVAAPLATSTQRGGAAYGIGLSLAVTVVFLVLIQLTRAIGGKGLITPELAAWLPSVLFGVAGGVMLRRTRS